MNTNKSRLFEGKKTGGGGTGGDGGDVIFNGKRPITRIPPTIEGFNPDTETLVDFVERVFYPAIPPECSLSFNNPVREIGATKAYVLSWDVVKQTNNITGITVDGIVETPTGDSQAGTEVGNVPTNTGGSHTKSMSVTDGSLSSGTNAALVYLPRVFWGTTAKNGTTSPITDADILAISNSDLRTYFQNSLVNFGGGNTRLIFAFPSGYGEPQFKVNGLNNTAFTKVRSNSNFVNALGATLVMDVWVSDNLYNSPLDSVELF